MSANPLPSTRRWVAFLAFALAGCGGGGGSAPPAASPTPPTAAAPTFRDLSFPAGFLPGTASLKTAQVSADRLSTSLQLPPGHDRAAVITWVNLGYADAGGQARTVGIVRWQTLVALGAQGLRLELPANVKQLTVQIYNAQGATTGSLAV